MAPINDLRMAKSFDGIDAKPVEQVFLLQQQAHCDGKKSEPLTTP